MRRSSWALTGAFFGGVGLLGGAPSCAGELKGDPASYRVARASTGPCDATPVFARRCGTSGCHSGDLPAGSLDLKSVGLPARLVGIASTNKGCESRLLVDPGDVSKSFVLEKLENSMPKCGDPMPLVGNLTAEELACIESYIASLGSRDGGASPGTDAGKGASTADAGGNQ
ncbi:MAG TPA: hypothetical protein VF395_02145 [Polyangiaceae bacterium]